MKLRVLRSLTSYGLMAIAFAVAGPSARADLSIYSMGGPPSGANYVNFNNLSPGTAGGMSNGIGVAFSGGAQAVTGASAGNYAPPYVSNGNGAPFGNPDGVDTSVYLSTETGTVTLSLPSPEKYFGLLWGSVDTFNTLTFYSGGAGGTVVGSITGSQVTTMANGDQGASGTFYVNINSLTAFDTVVASSTSNSFEFDNVSYSPMVATPEPATIVSAGIAGLVGVGYASLRRARRPKS